MNKSIKLTLTTAALSVALFAANPSASLAQGTTRVGIKGGLNASSLFYSTDGASNKKERIGFHAGLFAQIPAGEFFAIQPELLYMTKGASGDYNILGINGNNTFTLNYAELPVLATFKLGQAVEIQAGPYVGYLINSNVNSNGDFGSGVASINRDNFNRLDYGLAGGVNIYFGKAFIGARYEQGLQKIADSGAAKSLLGNAKNSVGLISVGFSLN